MNNKLVAVLVFGIVVYSLMFGFGDINGIDWSNFNLLSLPVIILLVSFGYFLRFLRWKYYLSSLGIFLEDKFSLLIFLSGFTMSITPSKIGEFIKCYLLKDKAGVSNAKTMPIVIAERFNDVLSMIFLSLLGAVYFLHDSFFIFLILAFIVLFFVLVRFEKTFNLLFVVLSKVPGFNKISLSMKELHVVFRNLFSLKSTFVSFILGTTAWLLEGLSFYLILLSFGFKVPLLLAIFVFALSSLIGVVSLLPGGLGATEASMIGLLLSYIPLSVASASTLIIRVLTLWYSVLVGFLAYLLLRKY